MALSQRAGYSLPRSSFGWGDRNTTPQQHNRATQALDVDSSTNQIGSNEAAIGGGFSGLSYHRRMRRSPCLDGLLTSCRGSRSGANVIEDLIRNHDAFFSASDNFQGPTALRIKADLNKILGQGIVLDRKVEVGELPHNLEDFVEQERNQFLLEARANALRNLSNLPRIPTVSSITSSPTNTSAPNTPAPSAPKDFFDDLDIEIDRDLTEQLTGYPFEKPAVMIRNHGAVLIRAGLINQSQLEAVVTRSSGNSIFLGPWIPAEAIRSIFHNGARIWRRPTEEATVDVAERGSRYERILNVAINPDEEITLAQRYLSRKHSSITDNYTLQQSGIEAIPRLERLGLQPELSPLPSRIRLNIAGTGNPFFPFGENMTFDQLCQNLAGLVYKRRLQGEIGIEPTLSLDFIGCGFLSEEQIQHLQAAFRTRRLSVPTVNQQVSLNEGVRNPVDLDFVISLSSEQFTVGTVSRLQNLHPTAVTYNVQSRPNLGTVNLYRQVPRTVLAPPKRLRINVIGHGAGAEVLGGMSLSSLGDTLAARIREGQVLGEFHVEAKITINFVACKVSPTSLAALYQAFKRKKIQLVGVHYRTTELLVDSAGRKLQRQNDGEWRHAHRKRVFVFNSDGQPTEMPSWPIPDPPDLFTLRDTAGPLLAKVEGQYHVRQLSEVLDSLKRENSLTEEWRPDLSSLTKIGEKQYEIKFRKSKEVVTIKTSKSSLAEFDAFSKTHAGIVGERYRFKEGALKPLERAGGGVVEANGISRSNRLLSSLFAIRMLIGADQALQSSYTDEIRVHTLVNLAQSIHLLGNETVDLAGSVRSLLVEKTALTEVAGGLTAARFLRGVNRVAGRGLVVASIGFDIYELTQAQTPEEKLRSGLMLGLDGAFVGLEMAAMAGVTATGPLALLLGVGLLAFEFGEWIYKQHLAHHHNEEAVYHYFENLRRAYLENTVEYDANRDVLRFAPGAVITSVLLDEQPGIQLDSQKLRITKVVSCSSGDERSSLAMANVFQVTDRFLNIQSEMGWPERKSIPSAAVLASNLLLPVSPKADLYYSYRTGDANDQVRRGEGARILQQLAQKDANLQFRACTQVIGVLTPIPRETQIKVRLGSRDRVLLMPPDLPKEIARCLKYTLEGGGGNYRLFPARDAEFTLREAATQNTPQPSNWVIDLSSLEELDDLNYTATAETLTFHDAVKGSVKIHIADVRGNIEVHSKLRKWRFDRGSNQLRMTYMDFAINELPQLRGVSLRSEINRKLDRLTAARGTNQTGADRNPIADALVAALQNQNIPVSDYWYLDAFPLDSIPQTVVCDVRNKVLITAGSDKLPNAKFAGRIGSSFYFSMGRMFWKGSVLGQPSSREQMLFFDQAQHHRINFWQENGITFISQLLPLETGNRLEAIYQLNDSGIPSLIKLIVPARDFRQRIRLDQPISASAAFRAIEEIATAPRTLLPSALITTATKSNLILLISRDQQNGEQRFWLDMMHNELVFLDENLPPDAIPIAKTNLGIFFYSDLVKKLYHRTAKSLAQSVLLMEGVRSLKLVEGQLQVEVNEGIIYEFNGEGKKRLIAVGAQWVEAHQTTLTNDIVRLALDQETAESIAIQGLKLANDQTFFCWYDRVQNQYTLASNKQTNEKLLHLGAGTLEGEGAWLFQPDSGRLYQAPTFTSKWMQFIMSHPNKALPITAELSETNPILAHEKFENVTRLQDGRLIGRTQSGLLLKLEMPGRPLVLAVKQNWISREANQKKHLALLAEDEDFQFHWNIDLPATESPSRLSWYDVKARKIITVPAKKLAGGLDYVGYTPASNTAYFGNSTKLIAIPMSDVNPQQQLSETRFQNPDRDQNIFSLQVKANISRQSCLPPVLAGVDTLLLYGNMDGLAINQELWNHHRLILLSRMFASPEESREVDQIDLQFPDAENLVTKRLGDDLVLEFPSPPASTRLMFKDFFSAGKIWNLSIHLPSGVRHQVRSQELSLQENGIKSLATFPI